jgi:hypothetical protein
MPRSFAVVLFFVAATAAANPIVITSVDVVVTKSPFGMQVVLAVPNLPSYYDGIVTIDTRPVTCFWFVPSLRCNVPPESTGKNHSVAISWHDNLSNTVLFNYPPPRIDDALSAPTGSFQDGLLIHGTAFGMWPTSKPIVTVGGAVCTVTRVLPTEIACIPPAGRGRVPVRVVAGEQASNEDVLVELHPKINFINPANGPTAGGTGITINGTGFGPSGRVTVGGVPCPASAWSDTIVVCTVPAGQGRLQSVVVDTSNQMGFTYDAPAVGNVTPVSGPWNGGIAITLRGVNFGTSASVTIGGQPCTVVGQSQAIIQCMLPASNGVFPGAVPVIVKVSDQQSAPASFTYLAP